MCTARALRVDGRGCVHLGLHTGFRCLPSVIFPLPSCLRFSMRLQCCPSSMLRSPLCPSVVECRQFQHPALFSYYGLPDADDACAHAARCCCACVVQRQFLRPSELSFRSRRSASSPSRVVRYFSGHSVVAFVGVLHKVHGRCARREHCESTVEDVFI